MHNGKNARLEDSATPLNELREQVERQELLLRKRTLETAYNWYDDYVNPAEPLFDTPDFFFPLAGENLPFNLDNRLKGELLPVYITDYGLKILRDYSRWLAAFNTFALNALENRISYIVGKGFGYTTIPVDGHASHYPSGDHELCRRAQRVIDRFLERTDWGEVEQEVMRRADVDGEAFIRFFHTGGGECTVRTVEPEHVRGPGDQSAHLSFGIETPEHDIQDALAFWVVEAPSISWSPARIPADEIIHIKLNVNRTAKRGYPTLVPVRKNLLRADKLLQNMSTLAQVQATFALIRKHKQYSTTAVQAWQQNQSDIAASDPVSGNTRYLQRYLPGTIIDAPEQTDYQFPSAHIPAESYVAVLQAELRAIAARLVMPEYMLTSNAENANYASTLVAEAPAVKNFERLQQHFARKFGDGRYGGPGRCGALWRVIEHAIEWGNLPRAVLERVAIQVEPPSPVARDKDRETTRAASLNKAGVLSKATWSRWEGLDPGQENQQIEQEKKQEQKQSNQSPPGQSLANKSSERSSFKRESNTVTESIRRLLEICLPHKSGRYVGTNVGYDPDNHNAPCRRNGDSSSSPRSKKAASSDSGSASARSKTSAGTNSSDAASTPGKRQGRKSSPPRNEMRISPFKVAYAAAINLGAAKEPAEAAKLVKEIFENGKKARISDKDIAELMGAVLLGHELVSHGKHTFDTVAPSNLWRDDGTVVETDVKSSQTHGYADKYDSKIKKIMAWLEHRGIPDYLVFAKGHGVYLHVGIDPAETPKFQRVNGHCAKRNVVEPAELDAGIDGKGSPVPFVKLADYKSLAEVATLSGKQVTKLRDRVRTAIGSLDMKKLQKHIEKQNETATDQNIDDLLTIVPEKVINKAAQKDAEAAIKAGYKAMGLTKEAATDRNIDDLLTTVPEKVITKAAQKDAEAAIKAGYKAMGLSDAQIQTELTRLRKLRAK